MSTLAYLDNNRGLNKNLKFTPWNTLHSWLSVINTTSTASAIQSNEDLLKQQRPPRRCPFVNRAKILEELESRRCRGGGRSKEAKPSLIDSALHLLNKDRGIGKDWRNYENSDGFTHLEELLIHQPVNWLVQVREYFFRFHYDLSRKSPNNDRCVLIDVNAVKRRIVMNTPILVVLFHPSIKRTDRYAPLNFLLAQGVPNPLPDLKHGLSKVDQKVFMQSLSSFDYFLQFRNYLDCGNIVVDDGFLLDGLQMIGKEAGVPRLCLINEVGFPSTNVIGQRLAKLMIRQAVISHVWNRYTCKINGIRTEGRPLSMIWTGPTTKISNEKVELATWLATLLNKPSMNKDNKCFIRLDCNTLSDETALNPIIQRDDPYRYKEFIRQISSTYPGGRRLLYALRDLVENILSNPGTVGVVVLDNIELADDGIVKTLHRLIDKGVWTRGRPLHNLIFLMTTNVCNSKVQSFVHQHDYIYGAIGGELDDLGFELSSQLRGVLHDNTLLTWDFLERTDLIVPFLPLAKGIPDESEAPEDDLINCESMIAAQVFMEHTMREDPLLTSEGKQSRLSKLAIDAVKKSLEEGGDDKDTFRPPMSYIRL